MLISYNADLLPKVRMLGQIRGLLDENKQQYKKICEAELKSLELQICRRTAFGIT